MRGSCAEFCRVVAVVVAFLSAWSSGSARADPPAPLVFPEPGRHEVSGEEGSSAVVYSPTAPPGHRAPAMVVLHGMCMEPTDVCDFWPAPARGESWVICPRGNTKCGGAPDWGGPNSARVASAKRSLAAFTAEHGDLVDPEDRILIGYSRGGYLARDILEDGSERFRGAVFLGAAVTPDPARLKAAGIRRVVLAAGDFDGARSTMERAAARLRAGGVEARYVSLGRMGHGIPSNVAEVLAEPLVWVRKTPD